MSEIHYEVFRRVGAKGGWKLHEVVTSRDRAVAMARDLMAGEKATGVKVVKETYNDETGDFLTLKIFEDGHNQVKIAPAQKDAPHALPCFKPDDLYSYHARQTMSRLLTDFLARNTVTITELIHRADLLEKLEATGTLYQHAIQKVARGLVLTDEGQALLPVLTDSFERIGRAMLRFRDGAVHEALTVGVVGTFAVRWLLPRLAQFREAYPLTEVRLRTHNNKVDLAAEGLDMAIRFGHGAWHAVRAVEILKAPLSPLCTPQIAARVDFPQDLASVPLLRSYRREEWPAWFGVVGVEPPPLSGPVFDSLSLMVQAALQGAGVALAPPNMFGRELHTGQLVQPFPAVADVGSYWLTSLKSKPLSPAMAAFEDWCQSAAFHQQTYEAN